jgi:hypothetical protein
MIFLSSSTTKHVKVFFTSNRSGGVGYDDIYKFIEDRPLLQQSLKG